jgi:RND family efflux transporter MFP subunit
MSDVKAKSPPATIGTSREIAWPANPIVRTAPRWGRRALALLITIGTVMLAMWLGRTAWDVYMGTPWTRDGTVRAYVVTMAPEVSGRIVGLPVTDNQFVHKDDPLMVIDPTNYAISVRLGEAAVQQAQAKMQNAVHEAWRRESLPDLAVSVEEQQTYQTQALATQAQYQQALSNLDQARVNLQRTVIRSPVNGWVTNLLAQRGDYSTEGQKLVSLVDADSFWVDGYFEETNVAAIHVGDRAEIKLMGHPQILHGHVDSVARAINVANAQPNGQGIATVNPIFTWVRLAQRIPVRIQLDSLPKDVALAAGMTATVQINPRTSSPVPNE